MKEALGLLAERPEDTVVNAAWDDLLHAALRAWSWRDPDTIGILEAEIRRVKPLVARDWSR